LLSASAAKQRADSLSGQADLSGNNQQFGSRLIERAVALEATNCGRITLQQFSRKEANNRAPVQVPLNLIKNSDRGLERRSNMW
jgi:hypothetical protein